MIGICAENDRHADLTIRAAQAGKHVLCEKPMALTLADCVRMIAAVESAGVTFMPCFPKRFCVIHQKTKDLISSDELVQVSSARIRHSHLLGYVDSFRNTWFADPARAGGGTVVDQAIHALEFLRWVFGEPESVTAEMTTLLPGLDLEDYVVALLRFPEDVLVVLQSSWTQQAGESTVEIFGERGTLIQSYGDLASIRAAPDGDPAPLRVWRTDDGDEGSWTEYDLTLFHEQSHRVQAEAFFATVTAGAPPALTAEDGRRAVELVAALYRAASEGARIDL
jgi:predicted dehydrogenase